MRRTSALKAVYLAVCNLDRWRLSDAALCLELYDTRAQLFQFASPGDLISIRR
jgi:hypothetical protein